MVAHEVAHIRNHDTRVMMLISVLLGGVVLLSDWAQRSLFSSRYGQRHRSHPLIAVPALLLIVLSPLVSRLLAMAVSRQREYLADATAVEFTRHPLGLAKALEKIREANADRFARPREARRTCSSPIRSGRVSMTGKGRWQTC